MSKSSTTSCPPGGTPALKRWRHYVARLSWGPGSRDQSSYSGALRAGSLGVQAEVAFDGIHKLITQGGGSPDANKLRSQIERAYEFVNAQANLGGSSSTRRRGPKPKFSPEALRGFTAKLDVADIEEFIKRRSPICPDHLGSEDFLAHLYRAGERVVIFSNHQSQGQLVWERDLYAAQAQPVPQGPEGVWYLVNPVDGRSHPNPRQGGKLSSRSEESVTSFRFAVLESDEADTRDWLRFLALVPLAITAIYSSGGRSLHALVRVNAATKREWDGFIQPVKGLLTTIGADPGCLSAVRLSRLPQAWRGDAQQRLIYLAPEADGLPIAERPERALLHEAIHWASLHQLTRRAINAMERERYRPVLAAHASDAQVASLLSWLDQSLQGGAR